MSKIKIKIQKDINGNKQAKIFSFGSNYFSIQTNGNLPYIHQELSMGDTIRDGEPHFGYAMSEVIQYVFEHGTDYQRNILRFEVR